MPWSIFTQGGGKGAARTWARDLLQKIGAPLTAGNEQFVYDWEVSEGGGGKFNPLNQGPVPGKPSLTTTGQQYGGGAADYASWDAGLTGAADYLAMPAYAGVTSALLAGQPAQARAALIASPWAHSHYGGGSGFSNEALPGHASALAPAGGSSGGGGGGFDWNPLSWPGQLIGGAASAVTSPITSTLEHMAIVVPVVLAAGALAVVGFVRMTGHTVSDINPAPKIAAVAPLAAAAA